MGSDFGGSRVTAVFGANRPDMVKLLRGAVGVWVSLWVVMMGYRQDGGGGFGGEARGNREAQ